MMEGIFYFSVILVLWTYAGYPLVELLRSRIWKRPFQKEPITPSVSMVIACHNEEAGIEKKIQNVLSLDYPEELLEIMIVSDGSTDKTEEIVKRYENKQIHLLCLPRGGKAPALNAAVEKVTGEILVFSDANSMYREDAIRNIVQPFADSSIGGVAGNQVYQKSRKKGIASDGETSYWNLDRILKKAQSDAGNTISATGAIYAIRRSLFMTVPEGVTDDFVTSTRVIAQKKRLIFEPEAICFEPVAGAAKSEFGRKTRVITRGLRGVLFMKELLNPFRFGFYSFQLFMHKVMRRLIVFIILLIGILSPLLWNHAWWFKAATILQILFYSEALAGLLFSKWGKKAPKFISIPFYFCMVNAAVLVAVWNILRGERIKLWSPDRLSVDSSNDSLSEIKPVDDNEQGKQKVPS